MAITYDQRRPEIDDIIAIYQSSGIKPRSGCRPHP